MYVALINQERKQVNGNEKIMFAAWKRLAFSATVLIDTCPEPSFYATQILNLYGKKF